MKLKIGERCNGAFARETKSSPKPWSSIRDVVRRKSCLDTRKWPVPGVMRMAVVPVKENERSM